MHSVLGHFVDAPRRRFNLLPVKMIERHTAFANRVSFLNRLGDVGFCQRGRLKQRASRRKMRGYR
jgi:hypothetical protein